MRDYQELPFSVAMSIYKNDNPRYLRTALESICTQSLPANEIYLVIDGPIGDELKNVVTEYADRYGNFTINQLEKNSGLGNALRIAVENCRYDLIMRMDSDDISAPGRFQKMINAYREHPVDVLGSWTVGFVGESPETGECSVAQRALEHEDIIKQINKKSPMSHVTVLMRKNAVLKAGNYQDLFYHEDYYLWARMIQSGCTFRNIPEYLVYVRLGANQAKRHGGLKYFMAERFLRKYLLDNKITSFWSYVKAMSVRFVYQLFLLPGIRNYVAMKYKRKKISNKESKEIFAKNVEDDLLIIQ